MSGPAGLMADGYVDVVLDRSIPLHVVLARHPLLAELEVKPQQIRQTFHQFYPLPT